MPRQISYDVAPVTACHVTVILAVDVPSVALTFVGAESGNLTITADELTPTSRKSLSVNGEDSPRYTVESLEQDENAESPMLVTLLGIVTLVNELQPENANGPMLVTLLGIVTHVNELQIQNAACTMLVTLLGIVTLVNELQT